MGMQAQQPPAMQATPQMLARGLQQQGMMRRGMPMTMQRQPQGGMAGPQGNMPIQMPNR